MHEIRFCREDEIKKLQLYIKQEWKNNHIFIKNEKLIKWQHLAKGNKRINFIVANNQETDEFDAIIGFIKTDHYDPALKGESDLWLAIWSVKNKYKSLGIGLSVYRKLIKETKPTTIAAIGTSVIAEKIYKAMRYYVGELCHYYIPNTSINIYSLAVIKKCLVDPVLNDTKVIEIKNESIPDVDDSKIPKKTASYFSSRYFNHPSYIYRFFKIITIHEVVSVFVARVIEQDGSKCIRIVDWMGDFPNDNIFDEILNILKNEDCEYIDMLAHVPDDYKVLKMGFLKKDPSIEMIPNYFEPFEKKNISVRFAFKGDINTYHIFKGDSDQDRPNLE